MTHSSSFERSPGGRFRQATRASSGPRIALVVDSELPSRLHTVGVVETVLPGWMVVQSEVGETVLDALRPDDLSLILLAPGSSGCDDVDSVERLRRRFGEIPLALLLEQADRRIQRQAQPCNVALLAKPLRVERFIDWLCALKLGSETPGA